MSLPFACPPVVTRQRGNEQSLYMRANAKRRVNILCDYAKAIALDEHDMVALAVEEVRAAYDNKLPPGTYGSARGYHFDVSKYGVLSNIQLGSPQQNLAWISAHKLRSAPQQLPPEYQFVPGSWYQALPTPPRDSPFLSCDAAQLPQVWPPADLPGTRFRGFVVPPAAYGGHHFDVAAAPQQNFSAAPPMHQPLYRLAVDEQHSNVAPVVGEQTFYPSAADEQPLPSLAAAMQQPHSAPAPPQQQSVNGPLEAHMRSILQQKIVTMDREEAHKTAMQLSHSNAESCQYPGYAPAAFI